MVEDQVVRVARTVPAPVVEVFRAWTEPARLAEWFGPGIYTVVSAEVDLRPGGDYRIVFQPREGGPVTLVGTYREIEAPRRLVFTWSWRHAWPEQPDSLVTVELTELPAGTQCVVTHAVETDAGAYAAGWESGLDKLLRLFGAAAPEGGDARCPWPSTS